MENELKNKTFKPLHELESIIEKLSTGKELKSVCMLELMDLLRDVNDKYVNGNLGKQERYHSVRSILKFLLIGRNIKVSFIEKLFNRIFNHNRLSIKHKSNSWELVFFDIDFSDYIFSDISFPRDTQFIGCKFNKTEFEKLRISKAFFKDCSFNDAVFRNSSLGMTSFKNCSLDNAVILNTRLGVNNQNSAEFNQCKMDGLQLEGLKGTRLSFKDCEMNGSKILNSNLAGSKLMSCNFNQSSFVDSNFKKSTFISCSMESINSFNSTKKMSFVGSAFTACSFNSSDLTSSDFRKAKLHACEFHEANVKHALGL